jgi:hypothetical protein
MKKLLIALFVGMIPCALWSQIPNYEFENWENAGLEGLTSWTLVGNVEKSTDATEGSHSVKLINDLSKATQTGLVTSSDNPNLYLKKEVYEEIPLVFRFDAKYELAPGDVAQAIAIFTIGNQQLANVFFDINGSSGDTFQTFKVPIQWGAAITPDSVLIAFSSNEFDNASPNGDGYIIIDNVSFESIGVPNANITNPSFNNWGSVDITHPTSWLTTDIVVPQLFGNLVDVNSVVESSESHYGTSMLLQSIEYSTSIIPGIALTGEVFDESFPPAFPVSEKWDYMQGYYKFLPDSTDTALVATFMYENGVLIGQGQIALFSEQDEITYFSVPITYFGVAGGVPDSASIVIASADFDNPKGANTKLWIDKLSYSNNVGNVEPIQFSSKIFPNPATSAVNLPAEFANKSGVICNLLGKELDYFSGNKVDVSTLTPGTYFIKVMGKNQSYSFKFVKI